MWVLDVLLEKEVTGAVKQANTHPTRTNASDSTRFLIWSNHWMFQCYSSRCEHPFGKLDTFLHFLLKTSFPFTSLMSESEFGGIKGGAESKKNESYIYMNSAMRESIARPAPLIRSRDILARISTRTRFLRNWCSATSLQVAQAYRYTHCSGNVDYQIHYRLHRNTRCDGTNNHLSGGVRPN